MHGIQSKRDHVFSWNPVMSDGCIFCASQYIDLELVGICDIIFLDERYQNSKIIMDQCMSDSHGREFHIYQKPCFMANHSSRMSLRATGLCQLMLGAHI